VVFCFCERARFRRMSIYNRKPLCYTYIRNIACYKGSVNIGMPF